MRLDVLVVELQRGDRSNLVVHLRLVVVLPHELVRRDSEANAKNPEVKGKGSIPVHGVR